MKHFSIILALLSSLAVCQAQEHQVIWLYEGDAPGYEGMKDNESIAGESVRNVVVPTLTVYLPEKDKACGSAMIIAPGGAFINLSMSNEGYEVAEWLCDHGVAAFVLKYRTRPLGDTEEAVNAKLGKIFAQLFGPDANPETPMLSRFGDSEECKAVHYGHQDGLQAMRVVRSRAGEFGIDPERVGIMGFSAGSVVAMNVGMYHDAQTRPGLVAPIYMGWVDPIVVPEDACPLYLVSPQHDLFTPEMPFNMYKAWTKANIEAELHYHAGVDHGFGMRKFGTTIDNWMEGLYRFMQQTGFVKTTTINSITIDEGGEGPYKSVVVEDAGLPGYTIVRPMNLAEAAKDGPIPVILYGNGGCTRDSWSYLPFLTNIASQGYIIISNGYWKDDGLDHRLIRQILNGGLERPREQQPRQRPQANPAMGQGSDTKKADALDYIRALDWLAQKASSPDSEYCGMVDTDNVAAMGQSCGGLQALVLSTLGDERIKTTVALNSGAFPSDTPMYLLPKDDLEKLSHPIIYIIGGETDIAYPNAMDDFKRITGIPVAMTNYPVGHAGTFHELHGGEFTKMALLWLDGTLKGKSANLEIFKDGTLPEGFSPKWTITGKNF